MCVFMNVCEGVCYVYVSVRVCVPYIYACK